MKIYDRLVQKMYDKYCPPPKAIVTKNGHRAYYFPPMPKLLKLMIKLQEWMK